MRSSIYRLLHQRFGDRENLMDRRAFLRGSAATVAGLYLSGCSGIGRSPSIVRGRPRVLVVGAGFGGLACAFELRSADYDVTVLEARKRLGGRVHTLKDLVPGKTVEAGASLIGDNHATWLAYAERFKLDLIDITIEPDDLKVPIVLGGERLQSAEAEQLYESLAIFEDAAADASSAIPDWLRPWDAPDAARLDRASLAEFLDGLGLGPRERALAEVLEASNNTRPTAQQSLLGALTAVRAGGGADYFLLSEVYRCRGGNSSLAEALAQEIGTERIHLGTAVQSIAWSEDGTEDGTVRVVDAKGTTHEADHVVLAVPPTVWGRISFQLGRLGQPGLPADLLPTFGPAVKVLAPVDSPYWLDTGWSQYGLSDGAIAMTWDGTYRQSDGGPAGLIGFSGATAAEELLAVPKDQRQAFFAERFEEYFPGYADHKSADAAFVRWPQDPWTRTGYSCPAPGTVTTVSKRIAEGLGRLQFAGEHASPGFFGYMEGALESGARLARRIAEADGVVEGPAVAAAA